METFQLRSTACVHELRLSGETLSPGLDDVAIHLVYRLDDAKFQALLSGLASDFAKELHDVVVRYATETGAVRITFNTFAFENWSFHQFKKPPGCEEASLASLPPGTKNQAWLRQT